jgi:hypothetical protein
MVIKSRGMTSARYVEDEKQILVGKSEEKVQLGRPSRSCEANMKIDLKELP